MVLWDKLKMSATSTNLSSKGVFTLPPILFHLERPIWLLMRHSGHLSEQAELAESTKTSLFE
ncbi:MAG: hypothetical protein BA865_07170 [Desulfobacterales bacterium S5133MH4]|nr:MAG: hypothetical protein BA865_07170 [Desulfobacterales bacterium S5133MH4]